MAADGTKVLASASKHSAVSYARAGEMIEQLELEVQQLLARAEQADATALQEGLTIPGEIVRRQERKAALAQARAEIEAWAQMRFAAQLAKRAAKRARREKVGGKPPQAPTPAPEPGNQYNFTNAESRIMEAGHGNHFEQNYKAQAAVEAESRLIVGQRVSQSPNGKAELVPTLSAMPARPGEGVAGMDAGLPGLQSQTAPSVGRGAETGGCGLKTGPGPPPEILPAALTGGPPGSGPTSSGRPPFEVVTPTVRGRCPHASTPALSQVRQAPMKTLI